MRFLSSFSRKFSIEWLTIENLLSIVGCVAFCLVDFRFIVFLQCAVSFINDSTGVRVRACLYSIFLAVCSSAEYTCVCVSVRVVFVVCACAF